MSYKKSYISMTCLENVLSNSKMLSSTDMTQHEDSSRWREGCMELAQCKRFLSLGRFRRDCSVFWYSSTNMSIVPPTPWGHTQSSHLADISKHPSHRAQNSSPTSTMFSIWITEKCYGLMPPLAFLTCMQVSFATYCMSNLPLNLADVWPRSWPTGFHTMSALC